LRFGFPDNVSANLTLAEDGVAADDSTFQHQGAKQFQGRFGLVGIGGNLLLAQDAAGLLIEHGQQMDAPLVSGQRAAKALAVQGHRLQGRIFRGRRHNFRNPPSQRRLELFGRQNHQQVAKRITRWRFTKKSQPMPYVGAL
jgi:hypothetical protein